MNPSTATDSVEPDLAEVELVTVLAALADPVRVEIVRQLAGCTRARACPAARWSCPWASPPRAIT